MVGEQYFLCPKCKELKKFFGEKHKEIKEYLIKPSTMVVAGVSVELCRDGLKEELIKSYCECGFKTEKYLAKDFLVVVIENENRIVPIGKYWAVDFKREFVRIAKKLMEE